MTKQINMAKVQDAYHYALAACPNGRNDGHESTFVGKDAEVSPSGYLRMAYRQAREAGCVTVSRPMRLADAPALASAIWQEAKTQGISAYQGELLCTSCVWHARDTGCGELCITCHSEFNAAKARLENERAACKAEPVCQKCDMPDALHVVGFCMPGLPQRTEKARAAAPAPTSRMPSVKVPLTEGDLSNLLFALCELSNSFEEQAKDPTQQNARALLELKIAEVRSLRERLTIAYNADGDGPIGEFVAPLAFTEHPDSRQATKKDLVDVAQALGLSNITLRDFSVPEIRGTIRVRLEHMAKAGKL